MVAVWRRAAPPFDRSRKEKAAHKGPLWIEQGGSGSSRGLLRKPRPGSGASAGFNIQDGDVVVGIEGDYGWARIFGEADCPNAFFDCESLLDRIGTVRFRVGFGANNVFLYGTAGLIAGRQTIQTVFLPGGAIPPSGTPTNGTTQWSVGPVAGLGVEIGAPNGLTGKIEVLWYNLGTRRYLVDNNLAVDAGHTGVLVRVGVNWLFGGGDDGSSS